ncbi:hypothetical protein [Gymnodinialimonas hymeniacidonis]|uniref:hypothetical protein n=1 Tax=Gymnodinialimonas hymeniacidonis TaxID=3126508 RepID=UPI0034C6750F
MAGFFGRLFSKRSAKDGSRSASKAKALFTSKGEVQLEPKAKGQPASVDARAAQIQATKTQIRYWQIRWHDLFDADQSLIAAGEFERPAPLPEREDLDFRLIFGLRQAELATREACFAPFPNGEEMAARFDQFLTSPLELLSEQEARAGVAEIAQMLPAMDPHEEVNFAKITVIDCDTQEGMDALRKTDNLTYTLENTPVHPYGSQNSTAVAARVFLTEPLYASAGNYYHLRDWVTGAMFDPRWDALQGILYRL